VGFWDLDRQTRHYRINRYIDEKYEKFCGLCVVFFKIVWTIAFIAVSYGVFQECQLDHHVWVVCNICNGIFGGVFFIYPLMIIINHDFTETYDNWIGYLFLFFCLICITLMISPLIGKGFI
jgi:hypothetical protein